jgi:succinate dehydrogenase / fumarate reductase cytochrome b subunit
MQTIGINGKIWFNRWKVIGIIYVTILMALFLIVVLAFAFGLAPSLCCDGGSCCEAAAACC